VWLGHGGGLVAVFEAGGTGVEIEHAVFSVTTVAYDPFTLSLAFVRWGR